MSEEAEIVADLVRAGVAPDLIGRVASALANRQPILIECEPLRSAGAIRQARYRERHKASQNVTERNAVTPPDKETPPTPPKEIKPPKKNPPSGVKKKGTRIPDDFRPDVAFGESLGVPKSRVVAETARFRDYWLAAPGQKGVKQDWPATWRNWIRRVADDLGCIPISCHDPPEGLKGKVVVANTDPRWPELRNRYRNETGKPLSAPKWAFPETWLEELA